jgi:hypothetical protein
LNYT